MELFPPDEDPKEEVYDGKNCRQEIAYWRDNIVKEELVRKASDKACKEIEKLIIKFPNTGWLKDVLRTAEEKKDNKWPKYNSKELFEIILSDKSSKPLTIEDRKKNLTKEQKADYEDYGYKCYDKIVITGEVKKRGNVFSNIILVNEYKTTLPDAKFLLLLRLIVEIKHDEDGWIDPIEFYKDKVLKIREIKGDKDDPASNKSVIINAATKAYSEIRKVIQPYLFEKDESKLIETNQKKLVRISTHPDFIEYDREKLLLHDNQEFRIWGRKLPDNKKGNSE